MAKLVKKMTAVLLTFVLLIVGTSYSSVAATDYNGFWRLIEIRVEEEEYFNPGPSDYRVRAIEFDEALPLDLKLGEIAVVNPVTTEELNGSAGLYQTILKWTHPQTTLIAGQKYNLRLMAQQDVNTTTLMLGSYITCAHQLLSPPGVYQPGIPTINGASLQLMNKEYGASGLAGDKTFEFTARTPDAKRENGYIFRVTIQNSNAYRRYDYIYQWVTGPIPASPEIRVFINGRLLVTEVPPLIVDGRTLLPLRAILEALGAEVGWDGATKTITATKAGTTLVLRVGSKEARLNNQMQLMDVSPLIVNDRTLVPARFLAESFGSLVGWDNDQRIVTITN